MLQPLFFEKIMKMRPIYSNSGSLAGRLRRATSHPLGTPVVLFGPMKVTAHAKSSSSRGGSARRGALGA